jgi:hypothetical protein
MASDAWTQKSATLILVFVMFIISMVTTVNLVSCYSNSARQDRLMEICADQGRLIEVWQTEHGPKVVCGAPVAPPKGVENVRPPS